MPVIAGPWTIEKNDPTYQGTATLRLNYTGAAGGHTLNMSHRELIDLRHVVDQSIKIAIRELPSERRLEV